MKMSKETIRTVLISAGACVVSAALVTVGYELGHSTGDNAQTTYWANVVDASSSHKASLIKVFDGPAPLTGLVIEGKQSGTQKVAWGIKGTHPLVIVGEVFNKGGENFTTAASKAEVPLSFQQPGAGLQQDQHTAATEPPTNASSQTLTKRNFTPDQILAAVKGNLAGGVTFGKESGDRDLYVFADANCPFCDDLYKRLSTSHSGVRIHWMPVAILNNTSSGRGAAILAGGAAALAANEKGFDPTTETGGIAPQDSDETHKHAVLINTVLLVHDGQPTVTPTLVWQGQDGAQIHAGEPSVNDMATILKSIQQSSEAK